MKFHWVKDEFLPTNEADAVKKAIHTACSIDYSVFSDENINGIECSFVEVYPSPKDLRYAAQVFTDLADSLEGRSE